MHKLLFSPLLVLILIYAFLIQGLFLPSTLQFYRFSEDTFYIYKYGNLISRCLVYIGFSISLLFPLILWFKERNKFKKNIILIFISFIPAMYYIILILLISLKKVSEYSM